MGKLHGSVTGGRGNAAGMLGEILVHKLVGGERVGHRCFAHDIELPNGLTVDVKTGKGEKEPMPHYVARVYAAEDRREHLTHKCDAYFFVRANTALSSAWMLGWMWADEFMAKAEFLPRGNVGPDGRLTYSDEWLVPISDLNPPSMPIEPRVKKKKRTPKKAA
jgi:hypothetical protein